jgi:hypothetical protein
MILRRRSYQSRHVRELSVDLLGGYNDPFDRRGATPAPQVEYLQPEPLSPPLRAANEDILSIRASNYDSVSSAPSSSLMTSGTSVSTDTRASKGTRRLVATSSSNIIQHDDAGNIPEEESASEPVELPPAYNSLKRNATQHGVDTAQKSRV